MNTPEYITTPFAAEGSKNTIPEAGTNQDILASMQLGFPPLTFQPIGGTPPDGRDVNGVLYQLYLNVQFMQAGSGQWPYNADFATAIGGYKKGQRVLHANKADQWLCTMDNNTSDPDNGGTGWQLLSAVQSDKAGLIAMWPRGEDTIPSNALVCKGQTLNSTQYPKLFTALYGEYIEGQTFSIPNFSDGYYPKGWGGNTQAVGTRQDCALPNITGHFSQESGNPTHFDGAFYRGPSVSGSSSNPGGETDQLFMFDASRSNAVYGRRSTTTVETNNVAVLFIIYTE